MNSERILRQRSWLKYRCSLDPTWDVTRIAAAEGKILLFMNVSPPDPRRCRSQRPYTHSTRPGTSDTEAGNQPTSQPARLNCLFNRHTASHVAKLRELIHPFSQTAIFHHLHTHPTIVLPSIELHPHYQLAVPPCSHRQPSIQ